jgi:hypothetical protein
MPFSSNTGRNKLKPKKNKWHTITKMTEAKTFKGQSFRAIGSAQNAVRKLPNYLSNLIQEDWISYDAEIATSLEKDRSEDNDQQKPAV